MVKTAINMVVILFVFHNIYLFFNFIGVKTLRPDITTVSRNGGDYMNESLRARFLAFLLMRLNYDCKTPEVWL